MIRIVSVMFVATTAACFTKPDLLADENDAGAGDAGVDAGLLRNGDFESGCSSWDDYYSEITQGTNARTGTGSCRVCRTTDPYYYIAQTIVQPFVQGERYIATAWIHVADKPTHPAGIVLEMRDNRSVTVDFEDGAQVAATDTWVKVEADLTVTATTGVDLIMRIGADFADGESCFLIDDATLHRVP